MKKKKTISAALATALALTCMGSGGGTAFAVPLSDADLQTLASQIQQINDTSDSATASETPSAQADAVEGWTIDSNIAQGGEILEMANGWLHLKSTASNGNAAANPSSSNNWPAVAVWGTDYDFSKAGVFCQVGVGRFGVSFSPCERRVSGRFGVGRSCWLLVIALVIA